MKSISTSLSYGMLYVALGMSVACGDVFAVTVTNTNDSGAGSLRDAMSSGVDEIDFSELFHDSPQTILLNSPLPPIEQSLTLVGPGADMLTIDGQFRQNPAALINIYSPEPIVHLEGFTLTGGYDRFSTGDVGGIFTRGEVLLSNVEIAENRGTGIFNQGGTLTIENSTIAENGKEGLFNQVATTTIISSTFALNTRVAVVVQGGDVTVRNSTIALNNRGFLGDVELDSSIVSNLEGDLWPGSMATNSLIKNAANFDGEGNITGVDPKLGPLDYNGGSTRTMLPRSGSRAIDAGSNSLGLLLDQRGFRRVAGSQIDIGAVETIPEPIGIQLFSLCMFACVAFRRRREDGN